MISTAAALDITETWWHKQEKHISSRFGRPEARGPMATAGGFWGPSSRLAPYFTKMRRFPQDSKIPQAERIRKNTWSVFWCLSTKLEMSVNENTQELVSVQGHSHVCSTPSTLKVRGHSPRNPRHWVAHVPTIILTLWTSEHLWFSWSNMNSMFFWDGLRQRVERKMYLFSVYYMPGRVLETIYTNFIWFSRSLLR